MARDSDADSLLELLHLDVVAVAVVGEIGVGVLARDIAHGQVHTAHELIDVVEAQRAPGVALTGLYDGVRVVEHGPQQPGLHLSPLFVAAVHGTHVVDVGVGDLLFVGPLVPAGNHVLDAGSVHAVHTAEYPLCGHFTRVFRGYALLDEQAFGLHRAFRHAVAVPVVVAAAAISTAREISARRDAARSRNWPRSVRLRPRGVGPTARRESAAGRTRGRKRRVPALRPACRAPGRSSHLRSR